LVTGTQMSARAPETSPEIDGDAPLSRLDSTAVASCSP
jgi:hypothetical protein